MQTTNSKIKSRDNTKGAMQRQTRRIKSAGSSIFHKDGRQMMPDYLDYDAGFDHNAEHDVLQQFIYATEAEVYLTEGSHNLQRSIVKYTFPQPVRDYRDLKPGDTIAWHYPNEVRALLHHIKPHPSIVELLEVNADRIPGRFMLRFAYCNGGDLVGQVDYTSHARRSTIQEPFLFHVLVEMADILAYTHHGLVHVGDGNYQYAQGHKSMIHGDIKEDNTFLRWDTPQAIKTGLPSITLGDWGTAIVAGSTNNKVGPGTWVFHAPEDVAIYAGHPYEHGRVAPVFQRLVDSRTTAVDIYALGHIMYKLCANENRNWAIGKDPAELEISREYETPGLREMVRSFLVVDPALRAEVSFEDGVGILPKIQKMREARDAMLERRGKPDMMDWLVRPKKIIWT